jgi:hypothetical protein
MAKVSIRKDELDRVLQIAERTARRTNERVVVAHERVELQDEQARRLPSNETYGEAMNLL